MPTEQEIRARAMQEFQMVVEVNQIRRQAIVDARNEALNATPAGRLAFNVYVEAESSANDALATEHEAAQHVCQVAEIAAHTKHGDANVAVMTTLQEDNATAEEAFRTTMADCEAQYQAAWTEAQRMVGVEADKARKVAKAARDKAMASCERARTKALAAADAKYQKALFASNEMMIAETVAAQNTMVASQQAARDNRDKALRLAATALGKAVNADPATRALEVDFRARLLSDAQLAEEEKAAVWERMHRDLKALGGGGVAG